MEPPVRRRLIALLVLAAVSGLVLAGSYFRISGLEPGIVYLTHSAATNESMEIDYRMRSPFQLRLEHVLDESSPEADAGGISVRLSPPHVRSEEIASFSSYYDPLRGQYYVNLRPTKKDGELLAEGNGRRVAIPIWCDEPVGRVAFNGVGRSRRDVAVGAEIAGIDGKSQHESIWARATGDDEELP